MRKSFARRFLAALVLLLVACLGCGTGEYNRRLEATKQRLKEESEFFKGMYPAKQLPDTSIMFQVPRELFQGENREETPLQERSEEEKKSIDAGRLIPPLVTLSGLKLTYEGLFSYADGSKIAYYCYLAAWKPMRSGGRGAAENVQRTLRNQLRKEVADSEVTSGPVECETPTGRSLWWHRLQSTHKQNFYFVEKDQKPSSRNVPGTMEFYTREEGDLVLLIGWRVPKDIQRHIGLSEWGPRVAGSVTVKQDEN